MLNTCVLTGNLGADPEVFYSSEGDPIASFNLAFQSSKKKTGWITVKSFNRLAEIVEKYLHKGARIAITGVLDQQVWETKEGNKGDQHMSQNLTTLENVLNRIDAMSATQIDHFINVDDIWFDNLQSVRISNHEHPLRPIAQRSIAWRLGIPFNYLCKVPARTASTSDESLVGARKKRTTILSF